MDGVTILTTYEKGLLTGYGCIGVIFTFVCIFALSVIILNEYQNGFQGCFASVCLIASMIGIFAAIIVTAVVLHTEYKITCDDTVSLNELTSCYQILSQDGKLFTVKELAENNE